MPTQRFSLNPIQCGSGVSPRYHIQ